MPPLHGSRWYSRKSSHYCPVLWWGPATNLSARTSRPATTQINRRRIGGLPDAILTGIHFRTLVDCRTSIADILDAGGGTGGNPNNIGGSEARTLAISIWKFA